MALHARVLFGMMLVSVNRRVQINASPDQIRLDSNLPFESFSGNVTQIRTLHGAGQDSRAKYVQGSLQTT